MVFVSTSYLRMIACNSSESFDLEKSALIGNECYVSFKIWINWNAFRPTSFHLVYFSDFRCWGSILPTAEYNTNPEVDKRAALHGSKQYQDEIAQEGWRFPALASGSLLSDVVNSFCINNWLLMCTDSINDWFICGCVQWNLEMWSGDWSIPPVENLQYSGTWRVAFITWYPNRLVARSRDVGRMKKRLPELGFHMAYPCLTVDSRGVVLKPLM